MMLLKTLFKDLLVLMSSLILSLLIELGGLLDDFSLLISSVIMGVILFILFQSSPNNRMKNCKQRLLSRSVMYLSKCPCVLQEL